MKNIKLINLIILTFNLLLSNIILVNNIYLITKTES